MFEALWHPVAEMGFLSASWMLGVTFLTMVILGLDNAAGLGTLAHKLPEEQRRKALLWGLYGAIFFRVAVVFGIGYLRNFWWLKPVGGGYLLFVACEMLFGDFLHGLFRRKNTQKAGWFKTLLARTKRWWPIAKTIAIFLAIAVFIGPFGVVLIQVEFLDLVFSVDGILAGTAITNTVLIVIVADLMSVFVMRYAAQIFARLMDKYPGLGRAGGHLVAIIGTKMLLEGLGVVEFEAPEPLFWIFWGMMIATIFNGVFEPHKRIKTRRDKKTSGEDRHHHLAPVRKNVQGGEENQTVIFQVHEHLGLFWW